MKLNPRGQVPVMVDGDTVVCESMASVFYLDERFPETPLLPKDLSKKAAALQRTFEEDNLTTKSRALMMPVYHNGFKAPEPDAKWESNLKDLVEELSRWESYLSSSEYIAGDEFTIADVKFIPGLLMMERFGCAFTNFPNLKAYLDKIKARPSVAKTTPPHWAENPAPTDVLAVLDK